MDADYNPIMSYTSKVSFTQITLASPYLIDGDYKVYLGGSVNGEAQYGIITEVTDYSLGTLLSYTGNCAGMGGPRPNQNINQILVPVQRSHLNPVVLSLVV